MVSIAEIVSLLMTSSLRNVGTINQIAAVKIRKTDQFHFTLIEAERSLLELPITVWASSYK